VLAVLVRGVSKERGVPHLFGEGNGERATKRWVVKAFVGADYFFPLPFSSSPLKYVLPRHFHDNGVVVPNGVHLLKLYFSSCFLLGGLRGVQTTASSALQVAASPLCLFPGLPLQAVIQVLEVKPQAAQTLALACVSRKLLPAYTRLALQASGFVLLKGWIMGGCMGSLLGGKCILKLSAQFLKKAFRLGGNTAVTASA